MKFISKLSKDTLVCSELLVKHYKDILKCSYGENPEENIFVETLCDVFSFVANKPVEYFKNLNIIDLFCFLLDLRINSQGNICKVVVTKDDNKIGLELNLQHIKNDLLKISENLLTLIEYNDIQICFECPSITRLLQKTNDDYLYFIKGAYFTKHKTKTFVEITTNEQAELLFEKLSVKFSSEIIKKFEQIIKNITETNFLSRYGIKEQSLVFLPSLESLIWFTQLIFSEPLDVFYDNLFYLAHLGHMSAEYTENAVVGEYNYFVSCLRRELNNSQEASSPDQIDVDIGGLIEDSI